jgi:hypothetical protein
MTGNSEPEDKKDYLPPLEFGSLVMPFFIQAMVKLGEVEDPVSGEMSDNLDLAKRLIDLLDMLHDRTKGNLEEVEEKFLEACLARLKLAYVERKKTAKP